MVTCMAESLLALGCVQWAYRRCTYIGAYDSESWPPATAEEFFPVPRICRLLLANYEKDLRDPQFPPIGGYRLNPDYVVKNVDYDTTLGQAPPYLIYADHDHREIVLAIRGLNMGNHCDYKVLLNNRLGMQMFDDGYVHHGLLKSAIWVFNQESDTIKRLWIENGSSYKIVFAGHSLGSGVAAMLTVIAVNHRDQLGGVAREDLLCYAVAPVRCMSLNLAVKYADVIHSVVLQDDFLPRTPTPLEDMFKSVFCLPCLLFSVCVTDTFIPQSRKLADPRRLYAPGRMYHIIERKFCSCGRYPPEVRTAIPIDGRFEHIVLSCNATSDHAIIWIEREAEKALTIMKENTAETLTTAPRVQRVERLQTLERERIIAHKARVGSIFPQDLTASEEDSPTSKGSSSEDLSTKSLDRVVERLLKGDESGELLLKKHKISPQ